MANSYPRKRLIAKALETPQAYESTNVREYSRTRQYTRALVLAYALHFVAHTLRRGRIGVMTVKNLGSS
jgi:hypothetical protein